VALSVSVFPSINSQFAINIKYEHGLTWLPQNPQNFQQKHVASKKNITYKLYVSKGCLRGVAQKMKKLA
jgi:hypothetical protein